MIYDFIRLLREDTGIFSWIKSIFYLCRSNNEYVSLSEIIKSNKKYKDNTIKAVMIALNDMGVLEKIDDKSLEWDKYKVNYNKLENLCIQVDGIISYLKEAEVNRNENSYKLIAKLPEPKKELVDYTYICRNVDPLYEEILELMSQAKKEIIILNPFFDVGGINLISDTLINRMREHVTVNIITRYSGDKWIGNRNALNALAKSVTATTGNTKYLNLYEYIYNDRRYDSTTFHAKAILIDFGNKAYIGSANLTGWGLDEQLEIGTVIEDKNAKALHDIIMYLVKEGIIQKIKSS